MAIKFCNHCKQPIQEGYVLNDDLYYCGEECLRTDNKDNQEIAAMSLDEMYDEEMQYYTEWHGDSPCYNIIQVFQLGNKFYNYEADATNAAKITDVISPKWYLVSDEDEKQLYELVNVKNNTRIYELTDKPFTVNESALFDTLEQARAAYEKLED